MKRIRILGLLLLSSLLLPIGFLRADVKTEEKSLVKFEGMLGRMMGLFGGKAAKEGTVNTVAVRGNRKAEMNDTTGTIIDLSEEKVYSLDLKKKTYEVATFAEIRRKILDAQEKAAKAAKAEPGEKRPQQGMDMELDFSAKESGQTKNINGFDCREIIVTITTRQKGKTLEDGGGMVMTSNIWMGPEIPALREIADFDRRYSQKLDLPNAFGADAEQMAAALAMYPGMKDMMAKSQAQQANMKGTAILTITTMETVQSKEQAAAAEKQQQDQGGGGGGINPMRNLGGILARKAAKKDDNAPKNRATILTTNHELLKAAPAASESDTAIPAGFKEKK